MPAPRRLPTARARAAAALTVAGLAAATVPGLAAATEPPVAATVTPPTAVVGKPVTVDAVLADPAWIGSTVRLEQRFSGVWQPVPGAEVVADDTAVSFPLASGWYGSRELQVVAVDGDAVELGRSATAVSEVVPAYTPRGKSSMRSFLPGTPRWNPCLPIRWKANLAKAPKGALADLKAAVKRIEQGSGIDFVYAGTSKKVPTGFDQVPGQDILVAWAPPTNPLLREAGKGVVGLAVPLWYASGAVNPDGSNAPEIVTAGIVMNTKFNKLLTKGFGRGYTRGEVLIHEIGHAIGLGHYSSTTQIMNPFITKNDALWGAGDLAGLERLGANRGCITPDPAARSRGALSGTIIH